MQCNDAYPSDYEETWHPVLAASVGNPVWANEIRELVADPDRLRNLVDADEAGRENPRSRGARSEHPGSPPPPRTPSAGRIPEPRTGRRGRGFLPGTTALLERRVERVSRSPRTAWRAADLAAGDMTSFLAPRRASARRLQAIRSDFFAAELPPLARGEVVDP